MLKFQRTTPVFAYGSRRITYFADEQQVQMLIESKRVTVRAKSKKLVTEVERVPVSSGFGLRSGSFGVDHVRVAPKHHGGPCGITYSHKGYHGDLPKGHVVA